MPATTRFIDGTGPVFSGALFPFLFITIACGSVSGFHSLISSGTTPKMVEKESHMRLIGFGGMLMESFVAIMALTAACVLDPGIYFAMNSPVRRHRHDGGERGPGHFQLGIHDHAGHDQPDGRGHRRELHPVARGRRADARRWAWRRSWRRPLGGKSMEAFWYHFAILFEALFILTAVDAGTRVGRFMIQDMLGHVYKPHGQHRVPAREPRRNRSVRRVVGLLPLPGRHRSARRHQHAMATIRRGQPDARRHRAAVVHQRAREDETRAVRLGHARAHGVAVDHDADRRRARRSSTAIRASASWRSRGSSATAAAEGKVLAPAKSIEEMQRVAFNNYLDAVVCGFFVLLVARDVRFRGEDLPAGVEAGEPDGARNTAARACARSAGMNAVELDGLSAARAALPARRSTLAYRSGTVVDRVRGIGQICRQMFGIPDYERYLAHAAARHPGAPVLSRRDFCAQAIERKYGKSGPRCC